MAHSWSLCGSRSCRWLKHGRTVIWHDPFQFHLFESGAVYRFSRERAVEVRYNEASLSGPSGRNSRHLCCVSTVRYLPASRVLLCCFLAAETPRRSGHKVHCRRSQPHLRPSGCPAICGCPLSRCAELQRIHEARRALV